MFPVDREGRPRLSLGIAGKGNLPGDRPSLNYPPNRSGSLPEMQNKTRPHALLIDDDPLVLDDMRGAMAETYSLSFASDSGEAKKLIARQIPDIIVCDINLNGENGLDLIEELKQQPTLASVPVIVLSSAQMPHIIRKSREVGGTYFLRKPFDPNVLLDILDRALWMPHLVNAHIRGNA